MVPWLRASGLVALILAFCLAGWPDVSEPAGSSQPARITTDSLSYCRQLAQRVDGLVQAMPRAAPAEALRLRSEGGRLCAKGELRGGLICLRRAVLILRGPPAVRP